MGVFSTGVRDCQCHGASKDFLKTHRALMEGLAKNAGRFR
jgi:hypothetical protein